MFSFSATNTAKVCSKPGVPWWRVLNTVLGARLYPFHPPSYRTSFHSHARDEVLNATVSVLTLIEHFRYFIKLTHVS